MELITVSNQWVCPEYPITTQDLAVTIAELLLLVYLFLYCIVYNIPVHIDIIFMNINNNYSLV